MAKNDPAWAAFRRELLQAMAETRVTNRQLADAIGETEATVAAWRQPHRGTPRLGLLPAIARELGMGRTEHREYDPLQLPRIMGMIPSPPGTSDVNHAVDLAYRVQKLELKLIEAQERAGDQGRRAGAAGIVRAAQASGRWAVANWPAIEGPPDCRLRVAERIDIIRTDTSDPTPLTAEEVWADAEMRHALRSAYAIRATRGPRWADHSTVPVSSWSILHVGGPTSPLIRVAHPGAPSIAVTALTVDSWANDVASLLATSIGYGLSSSRDMAMEVYGIGPQDQTTDQRLDIHHRFLERPPKRRCWAHYSGLSSGWDTLLDTPQKRADPEILHVWLPESDELLERWAQRPGLSGRDANGMRRDRDKITGHVSQLRDPNRVIVIPVHETADAAARWAQVLDCVQTVLTEATRRGCLPKNLDEPQRLALRHNPELAQPLFAWLDTHKETLR